MRISKGLFWFFISATVVAALAISRLLLPLLVILRKYDADIFGLALITPKGDEKKTDDVKGKGKATEEILEPTSQFTSSSSTTFLHSPPTLSFSLPSINAHTGLFMFLIGGIAGKIFRIPTLLILFVIVASSLWAFDFIGPVTIPAISLPSVPAWGVVSKEDAERKKMKKKQFWAAWADLKVEALQTARIKLAVIRKRCTEELGPAGAGVGVVGSGAGVGVVGETVVKDETEWFDETSA